MSRALDCDAQPPQQGPPAALHALHSLHPPSSLRGRPSSTTKVIGFMRRALEGDARHVDVRDRDVVARALEFSTKTF